VTVETITVCDALINLLECDKLSPVY
jgi:hypothetical protein